MIRRTSFGRSVILRDLLGSFTSTGMVTGTVILTGSADC